MPTLDHSKEPKMTQAVPYSAIDRFEPGFLERWTEIVFAMTKKTQFIGGEAVNYLERELALQAGVKEVRTCANGTDALQIVLSAVGVKAGDVVIVPDMTFWATFEAVCILGAKAVTVDIDPTDLHPSVALIEEAILKHRPKAVMLVHLYGWIARDTLAIRELCQREGVILIEDSAQAWGAELNGKPVFADALISTTSFYPGKVLGAAGDGGAIFTNDKNLADLSWKLANHGRITKYEHSHIGWNSRLDALQAAYLSLSLEHFPQRLASRRRAAQWYRDNLKNLPIDVLAPDASIKENGYISVATVSEKLRPQIMRALDNAKIGYGVVYPVPVSQQPAARALLHGSVNHGSAERLAKTVINLPCFAYISEAELQRVKTVLESCF